LFYQDLLQTQITQHHSLIFLISLQFLWHIFEFYFEIMKWFIVVSIESVVKLVEYKSLHFPITINRAAGLKMNAVYHYIGTIVLFGYICG